MDNGSLSGDIEEVGRLCCTSEYAVRHRWEGARQNGSRTATQRVGVLKEGPVARRGRGSAGSK